MSTTIVTPKAATIAMKELDALRAAFVSAGPTDLRAAIGEYLKALYAAADAAPPGRMSDADIEELDSPFSGLTVTETQKVLVELRASRASEAALRAEGVDARNRIKLLEAAAKAWEESAQGSYRREDEALKKHKARELELEAGWRAETERKVAAESENIRLEQDLRRATASAAHWDAVVATERPGDGKTLLIVYNRAHAENVRQQDAAAAAKRRDMWVIRPRECHHAGLLAVRRHLIAQATTEKSLDAAWMILLRLDPTGRGNHVSMRAAILAAFSATPADEVTTIDTVREMDRLRAEKAEAERRADGYNAAAGELTAELARAERKLQRLLTDAAQYQSGLRAEITAQSAELARAEKLLELYDDHQRRYEDWLCDDGPDGYEAILKEAWTYCIFAKGARDVADAQSAELKALRADNARLLGLIDRDRTGCGYARRPR